MNPVLNAAHGVESAGARPFAKLRWTALAVASALLMACGGGSDPAPIATATPPATSPTPAPEVTPTDKYASVPTPTVTGPIASEGYFSATKNYPFFASDMALSARGYVEEEFFIEGKANAYNVPSVISSFLTIDTVAPTVDATVVKADVPYKTRIVVRRPTDPAKFNGTVVVEWNNVTDNYGADYTWFVIKDELLRQGYAYVNVTAQQNAIANPTYGLKKFSPTRYGSLDVDGGGTLTPDEPAPYTAFSSPLSYDVFAQAAKAVRANPVLMKGLTIKNVIATGMSQSSARLSFYANYLHRQAPIFDAMMVADAAVPIRDDFGIPLIKIMSETETAGGRLVMDQPDIALRHSWWLAGAAHAGEPLRMGRTAVRIRDMGAASMFNDACTVGANTQVPTRSRVPMWQVWGAAVRQLKQQVETGAVPPSAPRFVSDGAATPAIARDADGNALGGLRLAALEAPTARMNGTECGNSGSWTPYTTARLQQLYPSHESYVTKVTAAANASAAAGFIMPEEAAKTIAAANASVVGTGLECGPLCLSVSHFREDSSSTGLLRDHTAYYDVKDGDNLIDAVDSAHNWMATGYSVTGSNARYDFNMAIAALQRYQQLVREAQADGRLTTTAADILSAEAATIIRLAQAL